MIVFKLKISENYRFQQNWIQKNKISQSEFRADLEYETKSFVAQIHH